MVRNVFFWLGLALLAGGSWAVYAPLGALVPGAVLVAVAIAGVRRSGDLPSRSHERAPREDRRGAGRPGPRGPGAAPKG